MEKHRINLISLKKTNTTNKSILSSNNNSISGPYYILPMIDKNLINTAYQESTSVLSKYISTQAKSIYQESQSFKISNAKSFNKYKKNKESHPKKINYKLYNSTAKTEANEIPTKSSKNINFYLTAQDNITNNYSSSSDLKKDNNEEETNNIKINLTEANTNNKKEINKKFDSSMSIDRILNKNQFKILNSSFHRIRTYQPKIVKNWKFNNGIAVVSNSKINTSIPRDAEYQSKLFEDQYKLLVDNYHYYKMKILANSDFIDSFRALDLKNKIKFNKTLEEVCGLLILLPRHFLSDFYKYIEYLKTPSKSSFKEKYIFDEVGCLFENNKLLYEIFEYFRNSFEIYLILIKEVDGMILKPKDFENVISAFERVRFDLNLVSNIAENALINYTKDMGMIYKLNRFDSEQNKLSNYIYTVKLRNYNSQSKTKEKQRKMRIEECLANFNDDYNNSNNKNKNINSKLNKNFKSIMDSKMISSLLRHCRKEVKDNIISERLNNEFDWKIDDNERIKNKPIKMNF